jgi:branched-chain amino acid transport system substrate-binding protein
MRLFVAPLIVTLALVGTATAQTPKELVIGVIYPRSGYFAMAGREALDGVQLATELVNNSHNIDLPFAKDKGLPGLGGARVRLIIEDDEGKAAVGVSKTEKLVTQDKVHALFGAYTSSVTAATSAVAEKYNRPYVNAESLATGLTQRGFRWFFRTGPNEGHLYGAVFEVLKELDKKGVVRGKRLARVYSAAGAAWAELMGDLAKIYGYRNVSLFT